MNIRSVLFDLDGTLVDSLDDLSEAVNRMRSEFALPPLTAAEVRLMVGKGARNLIQQSLPGYSSGDTERGLKMFVAYNEAHIADRSRLYPGVTDLLDLLRDRGVIMAVVSNKNESLSRKLLNQLNIHEYFRDICGGDTYEEMKPSPLPLLKSIEKLGCTASETLMIGDSTIDIQAGKRAGIATVGCRWGYGAQEELLESDFLAGSCSDISDLYHTLTGM